jgi:hypothetical protein
MATKTSEGNGSGTAVIVVATDTALEPVSNDAEEFVEYTSPYRAEVEITGTAPLLFHRWSCESVAEKAAAAKGSRAKKTDDVESYVYRLENGNIGLPGEYLRQSIINAARFRQDPRSPRKSAMDLFRAAILIEEELADLGKRNWDYLDQRRVVVQRNGVTRQRPALETGWKATFQVSVLLPHYVSPAVLHDTVTQAGMVIGLADFRPSYGRFRVTRFEVLSD